MFFYYFLLTISPSLFPVGPPHATTNIRNKKRAATPKSPSGAMNLSTRDSSLDPSPNVVSATTLRCERCRRPRSRAYHYVHLRDPLTNPSEGVCSRKRTGCAAVKAAKAAMFLEEILSPIHELPATRLT